MPSRPLALFGLICAFVSVSSAGAERSLPVRAIADLQGEGMRSPYEGRSVIVEGIVSADTRAGLAGLFVQQPGEESRRSHGLFVTGLTDPTLAVGDRLRITGEVCETSAGGGATLTTLQARQVERLARAQPVSVRVLRAPPPNWEALEGERVRFVVPLTLSGSDRLGRYGELTAAFGGRLWQPSEVAVPGTTQFAQMLAGNARRRVLLDDASSSRDPKRVAYLPPAADLRVGMALTAIEGVVDQRYDGQYRVQVLKPLALPPLPRLPAPQVAGTLRIAALNLENFFNGDGHGGGFPTERGAQTFMQFQAQLAKLVATIAPLRADVVALMELENDGNGKDAAIAQLVDALNADSHASDWRFVDTGNGPGTDMIRVGLIYRAGHVSVVGKPATLQGGPFDGHSRVPLAQAFRRGKGAVFVVVANHLKSKRCGNASGADADQGDGQACWNATRIASVERLQQWLRTDPTGFGATQTVLLGDFNAYAMETPLRLLRADGWQDAFAVAGVHQPYSYVYDGYSGRLDHALLGPALAQRLRGAVEWHVNADTMEEDGYLRRNLPGPWRSSDHDPLLLGLDL